MITDYQKPNWSALDSIKSRGSLAPKAASLASLHAKRQETLSQYWTQPWVVRYAWETIKHSFEGDGEYSILDNSVGSASMFRFAEPGRFHLCGFDVDGEVVATTAQALSDMGYRCDIVAADLAEVKLKRFNIAMINPPFSIQLDSPFLEPYPGITHYGKNGPNTSAVSDEYAVAQALKHCDIVCAVVPHRVTRIFKEIEPRLRAIYRLPRNTFKAENVEAVGVDLLIFGKDKAIACFEKKIDERSLPGNDLIDIVSAPTGKVHSPITPIGVEIGKSIIQIEATGDTRVIMSPDDRRIKLDFKDGVTKAKVLNRLYQEKLVSVRGQRLPKGVTYRGEFKLYLDVIVLQDDPWKALDEVCEIIQGAGGEPILTDDLKERLRHLIDEHKRMSIPYGRTVYRKGAPALTGTAKVTGLINRHEKGAVVKRGSKVKAIRTDSGFLLETETGTFECPHDTLFRLVDVNENIDNDGYWETICPPISDTYPEEIEALRQKAKKLGILKMLTWDFQIQDLLELAWKPKGGIVGWQMALGKTRLALALAMLLSGRSLIVLKPRLVGEMKNELKKLGFDKSLYKIIENARDIDDLRKINIISYNTNKAVANEQDGELIADILKGKVENVLADEGGLLSSEHSQQTKAIWKLGTEKNYILDGTPYPNYAREVLSLAEWVMGGSRSYQPYSTTGVYLSKDLFNFGQTACRARDMFNEHFAYIDWATNEWLDGGKGAKREMPKIKSENLGLFRSWLGPMVKRRVQLEPDVAKHVKFPVPIIHEPIVVEWDKDHLLVYIKAVYDFKRWYTQYLELQNKDKKAVNLTVILQNLEACFKAANVPDKLSGFTEPYTEVTSKQRAVVEHVCQLVEDGHRPIVFARTTSVLKKMASMVRERGITALTFTGDKTIKRRTQELDDQVRNGDVECVFAGIGVSCDGLNLPQLDSLIFYNRDFKAINEFQAMYRLLRCEQKREVNGYFYHLRGSIDVYMAQLVEWKKLASDAGLDYGEQPEDDDFVHFDAFFRRFIASSEKLEDLVTKRHSIIAA